MPDPDQIPLKMFDEKGVPEIVGTVHLLSGSYLISRVELYPEHMERRQELGKALSSYRKSQNYTRVFARHANPYAHISEEQ